MCPLMLIMLTDRQTVKKYLTSPVAEAIIAKMQRLDSTTTTTQLSHMNMFVGIIVYHKIYWTLNN